MDMQSLGRILLVVGAVIIVLGGLLLLFGRDGNLPGTIRVEGQGFSCAIPILVSIILSIVLTVVLNIVARWINRP